jgi:hypothetical protein
MQSDSNVGILHIWKNILQFTPHQEVHLVPGLEAGKFLQSLLLYLLVISGFIVSTIRGMY